MCATAPENSHVNQNHQRLAGNCLRSQKACCHCVTTRFTTSPLRHYRQRVFNKQFNFVCTFLIVRVLKILFKFILI